MSGLRVHGTSVGSALHLKDSPFWTLTPSYSQDVYVSNLRITAPMDRIGNTDGVNIGAHISSAQSFAIVCVGRAGGPCSALANEFHSLWRADSCRRVVVENIYTNNSDDGVCIKSGLLGFGLNLGVPSEDVLVQNITCDDAGRGGFAVGSEMSGGVRNVTYRNSRLGAGVNSRGIHIKAPLGRGGYIADLSFENIMAKDIQFRIGRDGVPLMPGNDYMPLVSNMRFSNISSFSEPICATTELANIGRACESCNRSKCFNVTFEHSQCHDKHGRLGPPLPPQTFACKRTAKTLFGEITLPWGVCLPLDAPVNLDPNYPNFGPAQGRYSSLVDCKAACV